MYSTVNLLPYGVWFGASNVCVSGVADPLPKRHTSRICEGHEDLSSCKAVLETVKFEEKLSTPSDFFVEIPIPDILSKIARFQPMFPVKTAVLFASYHECPGYCQF